MVMSRLGRSVMEKKWRALESYIDTLCYYLCTFCISNDFLFTVTGMSYSQSENLYCQRKNEAK